MASRMVVEKMALKAIQRYHHATLNTFGEHETLVDAVANRPGFFGPNPVAYLSVMVRRPTIHMGDLDEALLNDRTLVRATAFRTSLFLMCSADYPLYFRALYPLLKNNGLERLAEAGINEVLLFKFGRTLVEADFALQQTHEQIIEMLYPGKQKAPHIDVQRLLLRKLCDVGVLVRTNTKGWKGNDFSYALVQKWLTDTALTSDNPEAARTETVRRYLRCYGPASTEDVAWWSGLPQIQVQRSVSHLRREAVRIPVEGYKEDLIGLRESIDEIRAQPAIIDEILFLPPWDPYTFGWLNRRRLVERDLAGWVFDPVGNATGVITDCGKVVGVWQFRDSQINILEFHVFSPYAIRRKEIFRRAEEHAMALAALSGASAVNIFERALPPPLAERPLGSFLWPLGKEPPFKTPDERLLESPMERRTSNTFRSKYLDSDNVVRISDGNSSEEMRGELVN
jgi:hypothetical protein